MKRVRTQSVLETLTLFLVLLLLLPFSSQKKKKEEEENKPVEHVNKEFKFKISKPASLFWSMKEGTATDKKQAWVLLKIKRGGEEPVTVQLSAIDAKYYSEDKGIMEEREHIKKFFKEIKEEHEGKKSFKGNKGYWLSTKGKTEENQIFSRETYIFKRKAFIYIYRLEGGSKSLEKYSKDLKFIEQSVKFLK